MKEMTERRLREVKTGRFVIDLNMPKDYPAIKARPTEEGGVRDRFFAAKAELPDEITVIRPFCTDCFEKSNKNTYYVAPNGCDDAKGTKEEPLATLECALNRVRGLGGAKIVMRGGNYNLKDTVHITKEHSGTETSPLIITAEEGEIPAISSSEHIPASAFVPVTDEKMLARLKPEVRDKVLVADLPSLGITDYGEVSINISGNTDKVVKENVSVSGAMLLINNSPLSLARYPNEGEKLIPISDKIYAEGFSYEKGDIGPWEIGITDPRCLDWEWHDDIYLFGALCFEWTRFFARIGSFNREKMSIKGTGAFDVHPVKYDGYNTYFFTNVFEELDVPGEWYLDRTCGKLYLYPPKGTLDASDDIRFIAKPCDLIEADGVENAIIDRLDIGRCAGTALRIKNCERVLAQRLHITGTCNGYTPESAAVEIDDGYRSGIIASTIEHFSNRAGSVGGGDRKTLTPSNNFIQNCTVINPHNRFGLSSGGCGNVMSHNYLCDTTMGDGGHNEGIIEYNVIKGGDTETHDTGMIYVAGGGCSSCANHYRYNYFYDFAMGDYGIYFDDLSRGMYAYGNIVVGNGTTGDGTTWESGGRSYNHHNGGEHCFWNNISIDAGYFAFGGDISYWLCSFDHWKGFFKGIYSAAVDMSNDKYLGRNPTYKDYVAAVFQCHEDMKDPNYVEKSGAAERRLRTPWCNHYENNIILRAARPFKLDNGEETATGLETNFITDEDPGFVDLDGRDYRIRPDAPLYNKIPDFVPPPFEKMGLVDDFADEQ